MVNNYPHTSTESAKGKEEKEKESIGPMMKSNNLLDYFFFLVIYLKDLASMCPCPHQSI